MHIAHAGAVMIISALVTAAVPAAAQTGFTVCETQQQLEQYLQSDGQLMPDGCRRATVPVVETSAGRLCVLDLSREEGGIVGRLREVAETTRWWTDCDNLALPRGEQAEGG